MEEGGLRCVSSKVKNTLPVNTHTDANCRLPQHLSSDAEKSATETNQLASTVCQGAMRCTRCVTAVSEYNIAKAPDKVTVSQSERLGHKYRQIASEESGD